MNFEVIRRADNSRYANGYDIRLVNLAHISLFIKFILTTSSGKHMEVISHAHIVSLMCKLLTCSKNSDDLSFGFDRSRNRRRNEITNNKNVKSKFHLKSLLKDALGFAEHQEKHTYGLGYKLSLTGKKGDSVRDKAVGVADARIKIDHIHLYVPHYTPSIQ